MARAGHFRRFSPALKTGAVQQKKPSCAPSDAAVAGSVLEFASHSEDGGEGGNRNVEKELPHISQAVQVQIA